MVTIHTVGAMWILLWLLATAAVAWLHQTMRPLLEEGGCELAIVVLMIAQLAIVH
jgi:hypothetical protein